MERSVIRETHRAYNVLVPWIPLRFIQAAEPDSFIEQLTGNG